jgi:hypothetical protein
VQDGQPTGTRQNSYSQIKVAAFIYSSHTAAGVVKISKVWDKLQPLKDNYLYMHIKEYLQHLLFIYVTTNK